MIEKLLEIQQTHPHITFRKDWNITNDTLFRFGQCEALTRSISSIPILPSTRSNLLKVSLIKGALATTAIEGNTLSFEEVEKLVEGKSLSPSKEYQEIEIKNVLNSLNTLLFEATMDQVVNLLTPELIKRFHSMIGENLGEHLNAIPGHFRKVNVAVGVYKAPDYNDIEYLLGKLCEWNKQYFHYEKGQNFTDTLIQAVINHVYIAWIHPFSDGNGRTARLLEFYFLVRGGIPDIAAHILSNYYNQTRVEYYRQLNNAAKNKDLTEFIRYATLGFRDGLNEILDNLFANQIEITWKKLVYDTFAEKKENKYRNIDVFKRKRRLMLDFPLNKKLTFNEFYAISPEVTRNYAKKSLLTLRRDVNDLLELNLLLCENEKYRANVQLLSELFALRK